MSPLKFGLIGASYVAASRMMPAFAANGIAPKALFDTDESRFKYWVDAGLDLLTSDLEQLLDSDIDAVYISSATTSMLPRPSPRRTPGSTFCSRSRWL